MTKTKKILSLVDTLMQELEDAQEKKVEAKKVPVSMDPGEEFLEWREVIMSDLRAVMGEDFSCDLRSFFKSGLSHDEIVNEVLRTQEDTRVVATSFLEWSELVNTLLSKRAYPVISEMVRDGMLSASEVHDLYMEDKRPDVALENIVSMFGDTSSFDKKSLADDLLAYLDDDSLDDANQYEKDIQVIDKQPEVMRAEDFLGEACESSKNKIESLMGNVTYSPPPMEKVDNLDESIPPLDVGEGDDPGVLNDALDALMGSSSGAKVMPSLPTVRPPEGAPMPKMAKSSIGSEDIHGKA